MCADMDGNSHMAVLQFLPNGHERRGRRRSCSSGGDGDNWHMTRRLIIASGHHLKNWVSWLQKPMPGRVAVTASAFIFSALVCAEAVAAPEEIQVYLDDFTEAGQYGLDLHTNYVVSGQRPADHQFRLTPEFSYGINEHWDAAAYFLTFKDAGETPETDGVKFRARWRPHAPSPDSPFYWAVNFEVGRLSERFYPDQTSGEVKLIGVWKTSPWTLGVNLNLDRSLQRDPMQAATSEVDAKVAYQIREGLQVGVENYSFLGAIHNSPGQPQSSIANYLAADLKLGEWDLNVGLGHVSGQAPDRTILKAIIGVPL